MRYARSFALAVALALLVLPAAPMGGIVPIPTLGGEAAADVVQIDDVQGSCNDGATGHIGDGIIIATAALAVAFAPSPIGLGFGIASLALAAAKKGIEMAAGC